LPRKLGDRHPNEAQDGLLSGKKAFVIGGETVLGAAICAAMAKAGAGVCTYLNDDRLPAGYTPPRYSSFGNDVMVCKSTTDGPMNESLYMKIIREFGPIDICIHELGVGTLEFPASESGKKELSILSASLEKNLNCAREMVHFLYEQMSKKPWGRVVYVAPWAWDHYTDALRHNMVVSGVVALTRSFSESLSDSNANVNCVVPGFIRTPRPSEIQKIKTWEAQQKIPINRFGEISDVVNSVLFLLDDRSKYVTNQVLRVAGGI
jgi:NAD(P)-dependent dehydrogenase (short-subunit alcohol dehydrogenase family)